MIREPLIDDEELIARAERAYFRRFGKHADFPSSSANRVTTRGVVVLANGNGELARFQYDSRLDRLRYVAGS